MTPPYGVSPNSARVIVIEPTLDGWRSDSISPSSRSCLARSNSSSANAGCITTSAMIANACAALSERVEIDTSVASGPAPAPMLAPRLSIWLAISVAERVAVPRVTRSAVIDASPALSFGSSAAPAGMRRLAETSGSPGLLATITRRPLPSVFSTAAGTFAATGGPASGGSTREPSGASA